MYFELLGLLIWVSKPEDNYDQKCRSTITDICNGVVINGVGNLFSVQILMHAEY